MATQPKADQKQNRPSKKHPANSNQVNQGKQQLESGKEQPQEGQVNSKLNPNLNYKKS